MVTYDRERFRNTMSRPQAASVTQTRCDGTVLTYIRDQGYDQGINEVCRDVVTPNYHKRKSDGEIMNNPLHLTKVKRSGVCSSVYSIDYVPACSGLSIDKQNGIGHNRSILTGFSGNVWSIDYCQRELARLSTLVGTSARAGVTEPEVNLALFAAELDKTMSLLKHPFKTLRSTFNGLAKTQKFQRQLASLRARRLNEGMRRAQRDTGLINPPIKEVKLALSKIPATSLSVGEFLANNWLVYRFGILPTVKDIEDLLKVAKEPTLSPRLTSRNKSKVESVQDVTTVPYDELYFTGSTVQTSKTILIASAGVLYEHEMTLQDRTGYSLSNVPNTIWELVPYSFIVDRIVNIGKFIQAATPKARVKVLAEWTTTNNMVTKAVGWQATPKTVNNYAVSGNLSGSATSVETDVIRKPFVYTGLVMTSILHEGRALKESLYTKHLLDEVSLVLQSLSKKYY